MRKYFQVFISLLFLCLLFVWGCSKSKELSETEKWFLPNGKIKVLSTTAMIDDIVGQIGKQRIDHIALMTGDADPHSYELVKGDDEKLSMAALIFYNGLGLEHGASLRYQIERHAHAVGVGNCVLEKHPGLILRSGREIDPHIWMDVALWSKTIEPIADALSQADPEGKEYYQDNARKLKDELMKEHESICRALQNIPQEKRFLVTSHDAFHYYTRAYLSSTEEIANEQWQKRCDAPEGLAPEGQLSASDIQNVIGHLVQYRIQDVFAESNVSHDCLKKIVHACAQRGLEVKISHQVLYADAMGPKGSDAGTYLEMIRHNTNVLIETWR